MAKMTDERLQLGQGRPNRSHLDSMDRKTIPVSAEVTDSSEAPLTPEAKHTRLAPLMAGLFPHAMMNDVNNILYYSSVHCGPNRCKTDRSVYPQPYYKRPFMGQMLSAAQSNQP
jgi:hypothetical protein